MPKGDRVKLTISLPKDLSKRVDIASRKRGGKSAVVEEALARYFLGTYGGEKALEQAYAHMLEEIAETKQTGMNKLEKGNVRQAKRCFLFAAALELEALSLLVDPDEKIVKTALMHAVSLIKDGTGYRHLPDAPGGSKTAHAVA